MWTFLLPLILHAVENAPMELEAIEKLFSELGSQNGGVAKLASAASAFATLAERASYHSVVTSAMDRYHQELSPLLPPVTPTRAVDANGQPISDTQAEMQQTQG